MKKKNGKNGKNNKKKNNEDTLNSNQPVILTPNTNTTSHLNNAALSIANNFSLPSNSLNNNNNNTNNIIPVIINPSIQQPLSHPTSFIDPSPDPLPSNSPSSPSSSPLTLLHINNNNNNNNNINNNNSNVNSNNVGKHVVFLNLSNEEPDEETPQQRGESGNGNGSGGGGGGGGGGSLSPPSVSFPFHGFPFPWSFGGGGGGGNINAHGGGGGGGGGGSGGGVGVGNGITGMVKLNVGGSIFCTTINTLTQGKSSMLSAMFSGRYDPYTDADGCYFIDRDGTHFRFILNFLRDGCVRLPEDLQILQDLMVEAQYYQIPGLIEAIQEAPRLHKKEYITIRYLPANTYDGWPIRIEGPLEPHIIKELNGGSLPPDRETPEVRNMYGQSTTGWKVRGIFLTKIFNIIASYGWVLSTSNGSGGGKQRNFAEMYVFSRGKLLRHNMSKMNGEKRRSASYSYSHLFPDISDPNYYLPSDLNDPHHDHSHYDTVSVIQHSPRNSSHSPYDEQPNF